jgi:hypothetical protein
VELPNIFQIATKELSQDAFFTWLIQWADCKYHDYNLGLNKTAQDFVKFLIKQPDYPISKVEAGRQWENIDIWVEVNDQIFICIEDKTNTAEHSDQLDRYKIIVQKHYRNKDHQLIFIYLKTGNESLATLNKVNEKGYSVVGRNDILKILNKHRTNNEIFEDYKNYLNEIEEQTRLLDKLENITSNWRSGEGFFLKLQEHIDEWSDWRYVANQMGGFLGFWYHWNGTEEIGEIYIQIENAFEKGIKLVIKIADWEQNTQTLYRILSEFKPIAEKHNLVITKPDRYRAGKTSTLAIIQNAFQSDNSGNFEFNNFLNTLKSLEKTIDDYCLAKNQSL